MFSYFFVIIETREGFVFNLPLASIMLGKEEFREVGNI